LNIVFTRAQIEGAALIGIDVAKDADLGEWYQQVITKGQMISYYDVG
jgi:prolyl-tRNA synthetase